MADLSVLVIDDDIIQIKLMCVILESLECCSCELYTAMKPSEAYKLLTDNHIDLVITDYVMPEQTGLDVLRKVKQLNPHIDVVVVTAFQDIRQSVEIMKNGALDYLIKPITHQEVSSLIEFIVERRHVAQESEALYGGSSENEGDTPALETGIIATSDSMKEVLSLAARSAGSDAAVLLRGETGTGKEVIARAIHQASSRASAPFVTVNIAALPGELIESELFGHTKGAFTGAISERAGRFDQANGGTLFIDEVGDIPTAVQVKLLRVLQSGTFERVGDSGSRTVDVRIISATNQPLEERMEEGEFRIDFFYRLNVIEIDLPPLRERRSDVELLVRHFIDTFSGKNRKTVKGITSDALDTLVKYDFPGNVRELENVVERAAVLCRGELIGRQDIRLPLKGTPEDSIMDPRNLDVGHDEKLEAFERAMIREALKRSGGNQSVAARTLGISERRFRSRMERLEI
jgi:DNA-binding NtrC family response regulator